MNTRLVPRRRSAFTLIELLVVIAIIGILASMLVPAVVRAVVKAKTAKSRTEVTAIVGAINAYQADYSRLPATPRTRQAHSAKPPYAQGQFPTVATPDWVFGNVETPDPKNQMPTPSVVAAVGYQLVNDPQSGGRNPNNSEVMAILTGQTAPDVAAGMSELVNANNSQNPKRNVYLNVKIVPTRQPNGMDDLGVYRDPWGHPYVVIIDLDYDSRVLSPFPLVRAGQPAQARFIPGNVLVMSLGPDGKADFTMDQDHPNNWDNIYSWK